MRIVHVSTFDTNGGAARAAYRLHVGLRRLRHDSTMFVEDRQSEETSVLAFKPPMDPRRRLRRRLRRERIRRDLSRYGATRPSGYAMFSDDRSPHAGDVPDRLPPADIVNLHWIAGFVDYEAFFSAVPRRVPVVWTLHDMNAFTGGCHYALGCLRYNDGCGSCPQLGSRDPNDLSRRVWERKKRLFGMMDPDTLHIVALNRWMEAEVGRSALLGRFPVTVVPNGLDIDDFAPRDRRTAREVFGIPQDARVLLIDSGSVGQRHKGFALLCEALEGIGDSPPVWVVSLGSVVPRIAGPLRHLHLGFINGDRLLSLAYSTADLTVVPSLQDNFPNIALEAMACGVPVAGFAVGGVPDIVRPEVTGLLAQPGDAASLRRAIVGLLEGDEARRRMAAGCRVIAIEEYSNMRQASRYLDLYARILGREGGP